MYYTHFGTCQTSSALIWLRCFLQPNLYMVMEIDKNYNHKTNETTQLNGIRDILVVREHSTTRNCSYVPSTFPQKYSSFTHILCYFVHALTAKYVSTSNNVVKRQHIRTLARRRMLPYDENKSYAVQLRMNACMQTIESEKQTANK